MHAFPLYLPIPLPKSPVPRDTQVHLRLFSLLAIVPDKSSPGFYLQETTPLLAGGLQVRILKTSSFQPPLFSFFPSSLILSFLFFSVKSVTLTLRVRFVGYFIRVRSFLRSDSPLTSILVDPFCSGWHGLPIQSLTRSCGAETTSAPES